MILKRLAAALLAALAGTFTAACTTDGQVEVHQPTSARPVIATRSSRDSETSGAIFGSGSYQPLFEDRRARHVGDTLTVVINENISASRNSDSSAERQGSVSYAVPKIAGLPGKFMQGGAVTANSDNKFEGKGASTAANQFSGSVTVTVTEVLENGNLVVSGEKQIGINRDSQTVRLSGVVNPALIVAGNSVSSTQIADARIDFRGKGYIDEAQTMGWLQRFFLSAMPF